MPKTYSWDFDDGKTSVAIEPTHKFDEAGEYDVKLVVQNKNLRDETTNTIVVGNPEISINPKTYELGISWLEYYANSFEESGDWAEGTDANWVKEISDGHYKLTNNLEENLYLFWTNVIGMPASTKNYDIEVYFTIEYDNVTEGDGIFWALDPDAFDYYYYRYSIYEGTGYFIVGDSKNGSWLTNTWSTGNINIAGYNKLTVRKYNNSYCIFMNEVLVKEESYGGDFGPKFGFIVGAGSKMLVDWFGIWEMDLSTQKAKNPKTISNDRRIPVPEEMDLLKEFRTESKLK